MQIMTANNTLAQFVIDKAHCIDCWGFNFCPSYSSLELLKDYGVPIVALTATATDRTLSPIATGKPSYCYSVVSKEQLRSIHNLQFPVM